MNGLPRGVGILESSAHADDGKGAGAPALTAGGLSLDAQVLSAERLPATGCGQAWVSEDAAEVGRKQREGERRLSAAMNEFAQQSAKQVMENRKVRTAVNELSEELEYLRSKVADDSPGYWATGHLLPNKQWAAHGSLLAAKDNAAHAAVGKAYHEADRLNHCVPRMLAGSPTQSPFAPASRSDSPLRTRLPRLSSTVCLRP